jgi:hypothetical protein
VLTQSQVQTGCNAALLAYDTNGVASVNDLAAIGVDLTPVLAKLPESGRASTQASVDALSLAISGSPVEPTGITVFELLEGIQTDIGSFSEVAARLAVEGQILGFPAAIVRNADYHADAESEILLTLQDLTGAAITEINGTPVASVSWLFGMGTESQRNLITGTATWATDRLKIEWLSAATAGKALGTLTWQIGATVGGKTRWLGGGTTRLIERQF